MNYLEKATAALVQAEEDLRSLVSQAAAANKWDEVASIAGLASRLRAVLEACGVPISIVPSEDETEKAPSYRTAREPASLTPSSATPERRGRPRGIRGQRYPLFIRDAQSLIKIGHSKKGAKTEYEHRAPKSVLELLTATIMRVGAARARFALDDVIPLIDTEREAEVPTYQVYLCIAWMRKQELITQHGRQGYSIRRLSGFSDDVSKAWLVTPERREG
jgi:hypothetical protein